MKTMVKRKNIYIEGEGTVKKITKKREKKG